MSVGIAICDTNQEEVENCRQLIEAAARGKAIEVDIQCFASNQELFFWMDENPQKNHIIFIDVNNYDEGNGSAKAAREIKERYKDKEIIFFTHRKDKFKEAFDVHALNYFVKDEDTSHRFDSIFSEAVFRVQENEQKYIMLNSAGEYRCISVDDISYFESMNRIITVHYEGDSFEFVSTMSKLEEHLNNFGFLRIHKSFLVSIRQIKGIKGRTVYLKDDTALSIGRVYYKQVKELVDKMVQESILS